MGEFNIIPILGRKKDVPPNALSMFQYKKDGSIYTHDAGGVNFDLSRGPGLCDKSYGYNKLSTKPVSVLAIDLLTATVYDPNSKISIPSSDFINFTNVTKDDDDTYAIIDYGPNYFGEGRTNYEIDFEINITTTGSHKCYVIGLSNVDQDIQWLLTGANLAVCDAVGIYTSSSGGYYYFGLHSAYVGNVLNDFTDTAGTSFAFGTTYYCKLYRDVSQATYGQLTLDVYSDRFMATVDLIDSLTLDLDEDSGDDFRYIIPFSGNDAGAGGSGPTGSIGYIYNYTEVTF